MFVFATQMNGVHEYGLGRLETLFKNESPVPQCNLHWMAHKYVQRDG